MPWYNGAFPPSYKNQPTELREKAVEIANQLLEQGTDEGIAIATGLKRARLFFKKQNPPMRTDHQYIEAFHDHEEFMMKKRQYAKALHIFHDQTSQYNEVVDDLPLKEIEAKQKEFLQHERDFHHVMDSFDRALDAYQETVRKLKKQSTPVRFTIGRKKYQMRVLKGDIELKEIQLPWSFPLL